MNEQLTTKVKINIKIKNNIIKNFEKRSNLTTITISFKFLNIEKRFVLKIITFEINKKNFLFKVDFDN